MDLGFSKELFGFLLETFYNQLSHVNKSKVVYNMKDRSNWIKTPLRFL